METVVNLMLKGETNATQIARQTGLKRALVVEYMTAWKQIAQNDKGVKARAREALTEMDRHYSLIIKEMWGLVEDVETGAVVKSNTLKAIADVEHKRQDALQKAGLYADTGIADELVAMEEKAEAIKVLLQQVAQKWPETMPFIMEGIRRIYDQGVVIEDA